MRLRQAGVGREDRALPAAALGQMALAVVLLGAAWPLTRWGVLHGAVPAWFALGRAGLSAAATFALLGVMGRLRLPRRRDLPALLGVGLLQFAGFFAFAHAAVAWVGAGRTAVLANCTIVFLVPLSLLTGERISRRRWAAAGLGLGGVAVLTGPWAIDWGSAHVLLGHAFLLGSALCWSLAIVIVRRYPARLSMFELLPWTFGLATLALLPLALAHGVGDWSGEAVWPLLAVGLLIAPVGSWCILAAQLVLPVVVSSVGFLAGPAVGVVLSSVFLGEAIGPDMIGGAVLIFAAAALASTKGRGA